MSGAVIIIVLGALYSLSISCKQVIHRQHVLNAVSIGTIANTIRSDECNAQLEKRVRCTVLFSSIRSSAQINKRCFRRRNKGE